METCLGSECIMKLYGGSGGHDYDDDDDDDDGCGCIRTFGSKDCSDVEVVVIMVGIQDLLKHKERLGGSQEVGTTTTTTTTAAAAAAPPLLPLPLHRMDAVVVSDMRSITAKGDY